MKYLLLLLTLFTSTVFAGKEYTIDIQVVLGGTEQGIEGITIELESGSKVIATQLTNAEGKAQFTHVKKRSVSLRAKDTSGDYYCSQIQLVYAKDEDESVSFSMRYSKEIEEEKWNEVDNKYAAEVTESLLYEMDDNDDLYPEVEAGFVGGTAALQQFINSSVYYPQGALERGVQGRVYVTFLVQKDGTVTNVSVRKGTSPELDMEAVRVMRYSPKWIPAKHKKEPVICKVTVPINFTLY